MGLPGTPRSFFATNFPEFKLPDSLEESGWWGERPFETEEACQLRAERIWSDLLTRQGDKDGQPEERVAFVSHGGFFMPDVRHPQPALEERLERARQGRELWWKQRLVGDWAGPEVTPTEMPTSSSIFGSLIGLRTKTKKQ